MFFDVFLLCLSGLGPFFIVLNSKTISNHINFRKTARLLHKSQFGQILQSEHGVISLGDMTATKAENKGRKALKGSVKQLEVHKAASVKQTVTSSEIVSYVKDYENLPKAMYNRVSVLLRLMSQVENKKLSIEDAHDMSVIAEQVLSALTLFEGLPSSHQTKVLQRELIQQWKVLEKAVQNIFDNNVKADVDALKAGSVFVDKKFSEGLRIK